MARFRYRRGRRYNRRGRKLSKANIYGNRSARSQAGQIAALNRKINYISRRDRPEVKTLVRSPNSFTFTSATLDNTYSIYIQPLPQPGSSDHGIIGDVYKILSYQLFINMEYFNNSTTGYHDSESAGCTYRILCLQAKAIDSDSLPEGISNILEFTANTGAAYSLMTRSPMVTGITKRYRVLFDKTYSLTTNRNQGTHRIILRPKSNTVRTQTGQSNPASISNNQIITYLITSGLHTDLNFTETVEGSVSSKIAYTDN